MVAFLSLLLCTSLAFAQTTVSGKVTKAKGDPLPQADFNRDLYTK